MIAGAQPLLLVGAGKMGGAMLDRWMEGFAPSGIVVLDPFLDEERAAALGSAGVKVAGGPAGIGPVRFQTVVLAVKPQSVAETLPVVAPLVGSDTVVVSIAAGVRLATLAAAFPAGQPVVRAMPNTPAQIGRGVSVAVANRHVADPQRAAVEALLAAVGKVAWVTDEALIDAVTAVSGSGPAYVFLLAECLSEAARRAGLPADLAGLLARETVAGSGALLGESELPPETLRKNVTSPGGTTAAALAILMGEDGLESLLVRAVEAAKRRSIELG